MSGTVDLVIRADAVVTASGTRPAAVVVHQGRITAIEDRDTPVAADREVVLGDGEVLLPGLVDTHVHVNEPGRTEWEGYATATAAALAGGVTTILDMPLNSIPPTVDPDSLAVKRDVAAGKARVDVGFWGGAIPQNLGSLRALHDAGVFGFKCFLAPSGVDEFPHLTTEQLNRALDELAGFGGLLIVHAEDPDVLDAHVNAGGRHYPDFVASRPDAAETTAIGHVIDGVRRTGARAHILHLSSAAALPQLAAARAEGLPITVETCPHYLSFSAEEIPDGATAYKCCPPIRDEGNRERLWQALADGVIDIVVSDHSPSTAELKQGHGGDFGRAWGGISSLQLGLSAVWTGARKRGIALEQVVRWMATRPADLAGLTDRGRIAVGAKADLVAFAPGAEFTVAAAALEHRNPVSAFDGHRLDGIVRRRWLGGAESSPDGARRGALLSRPDAEPAQG